MARDYKHRAQPRAKKKQQPSCWVWLIVGFLLGALTVGLSWLKLGTDAVKDNQWIGDKPAKSESKRPVAPPPKFDFYDRLPEMEVVVPEEDLPAASTAPAGSPAKAEGPFLIQVGSFKKASDADRLKAQLTLLGMPVKVSRVKIDDGDTWHRVRVGPFDSRKDLDKARKRLAENKLRGIVIKAAAG